MLSTVDFRFLESTYWPNYCDKTDGKQYQPCQFNRASAEGREWDVDLEKRDKERAGALIPLLYKKIKDTYS